MKEVMSREKVVWVGTVTGRTKRSSPPAFQDLREINPKYVERSQVVTDFSEMEKAVLKNMSIPKDLLEKQKYKGI